MLHVYGQLAELCPRAFLQRQVSILSFGFDFLRHDTNGPALLETMHLRTLSSLLTIPITLLKRSCVIEGHVSPRLDPRATVPAPIHEGYYCWSLSL